MRYYPGGGIGHRLGGHTDIQEDADDMEGVQDVDDSEGIDREPDAQIADDLQGEGSDTGSDQDEDREEMVFEDDEEEPWLDVHDEDIDNDDIEDDGFGDF